MEPELPHKGVIFAEGDFGGTHGFNSAAELNAFIKGVHAGADLYGSGSVCVYTKADLDDGMSERKRAVVRRELGLPEEVA